MNQRIPHVVIVGAGFGGLRAAQHLRKAQVKITVIDRSNHHLFQPLLYQVATGGLSPASIATPIRSVLRNQENTEVLMSEVIGINSEEKKVIMSDRTVQYDYLILATGARHSYFGKNEWENYAPGLKSVEDATTIRKKILLAFEAAEMAQDLQTQKSLLNFIVVGGGPTGVEMAGSIAELAHKALASDFRHIDPTSARIILIEAGTRVLASFPEDLSEKAKKSLEKLGVEVRTGARVQEITSDGVFVSGEFIPSKCVVWAAGVIASPVGKWLNVETDRVGRVKVEKDLSVPGHPNIFVIGDAAYAVDNKGQSLPGVAPVAMQEGKYIASVIKRKVRGEKDWPAFHYVDKGSLATIGRASAVADIWKFHISGVVAWLTWLFVHIFYLIGFKNRILVLLEWAWSYLTFQRGARIITMESRDIPTSPDKIEFVKGKAI